MKKVLILGMDGYIGWSLALHLLNNGNEVSGMDNFSRRERVHDLGSRSLTPIISNPERTNLLNHYKNFKGMFSSCNLHDNHFYITKLLEDIQPDTIIHLAEQPSASWSMKGPEYASTTQYENVIGNLNLLWAIKKVNPDIHLIKLGTMGEYGKPDCDIPEGMIPKTCLADKEFPMRNYIACPMAGLPFPRTANSFYHLTKVHDTHNIIFACRNWGLRSTDIMQGVVFGLNEALSPDYLTRFDYDECFGTVINRFCAQVVSDNPLTVFGTGNQKYSFLPLKDSLQCITLAINTPALSGEYRTLNQFQGVYSIDNLAGKVTRAGIRIGLKPQIQYIKNPRNESEDHYYNPIHENLHNLGYQPTLDIQKDIDQLVVDLLPYKNRVVKKVLMPKITWR